MPRVAELTSPAVRLREAYDLLEARWNHTLEAWTDANSAAFQDEYMSQLRPTVMSALEAVGRLDQILLSMQRQCERP